MVDPLIAESVRMALLTVMGGFMGGIATRTRNYDKEWKMWVVVALAVLSMAGIWYFTSLLVSNVTP